MRITGSDCCRASALPRISIPRGRQGGGTSSMTMAARWLRYMAELLGHWEIDAANFDDILAGAEAPAHRGNVWSAIGPDGRKAREFPTRSEVPEFGFGEDALRHCVSLRELAADWNLLRSWHAHAASGPC